MTADATGPVPPPAARRRIARRASAAVAILVLAGAAVAPWTVNPDRLLAGVSRQIGSAYGLQVRVSGRTSIAFLPVPRIKFARVSLSAANGTELVRDAQLKGELLVLPLLAGRVVLSEITLAGGTVLAGRTPDGRSAWREPLARAVAAETASDGAPRLGRIVVTGSDVLLGDGPGGTAARRLSLVAAWPRSGPLDVVGSASWREDTIEAKLAIPSPGALLAGDAGPVTAEIAGRHGKASFSGQAGMRGGLRLAGQASAETASAGALARWLGLADVPAELDRPVGLRGEARFDGDGLDVAGLQVDLGRDRLDGALSVGLTGGWAAQATLAAGVVDLGWLLRALEPSLLAWTEDGAPLPVPGGSLDLRLSAADLHLGPLSFTDAAAGLLVNADRVEATLMRAGIEGGTIKGRVAATSGPRRGVKAQATIDNVEVGTLLASLGAPAYLSGRTSGTASFEGVADPGASVLRQLGGRAVVTVRKGELAGSDITQALRRADLRPTSILPWRSARTGFDQAQLSLTLANGVAEIVEGTVDGAAIRATLEGRVSLPDRFVSLRAIAAPASGTGEAGTGAVLDVNGPWSSTTALPGPVPPETGRGPVIR